MEAIKKLVSALGISPAPAKKSAAESVDVARGDGLTELVVWSVPPVNRQLLICHRPGEDGGNPTRLVSVQVRDNSRFLKKMALVARQVSAQRFILEGPLPRWRGKW